MSNSSIGTQDKSENWRFRHDDIALKIDQIEKIYAESNIKLNQSSQLSELLRSARELSGAWSRGESNETDMVLLFKTLHIERISSAIHFLKFENDKDKYLKNLLRGTLNLFERKPSQAKSILWELEVWSKIKKVIPETHLNEPDVVVSSGKYQIAIPCKKIFSEKGVSKVLSNAVSQIESSHEFGIVAMNIDDLLPADVVLNARTFDELGDKLHSKNMQFLKRHERHFLKYLSESRIIAVIASTSIVVDIHDESPKFNNANQWAIWTVPNLNGLLPKPLSFLHQHEIKCSHRDDVKENLTT